MKYPKRKQPRLQDYDYSQEGAYFITICTEGRNECLSEITVFNEGVGRGDPDTPQVVTLLSKLGKIVEKYLLEIPNHYPEISVGKYVIMPDHIHLLLRMDCGTGNPSPTLGTIIGGYKYQVTKQINLLQNPKSEDVIFVVSDRNISNTLCGW